MITATIEGLPARTDDELAELADHQTFLVVRVVTLAAGRFDQPVAQKLFDAAELAVECRREQARRAGQDPDTIEINPVVATWARRGGEPPKGGEAA